MYHGRHSFPVSSVSSISDLITLERFLSCADEIDIESFDIDVIRTGLSHWIDSILIEHTSAC